MMSPQQLADAELVEKAQDVPVYLANLVKVLEESVGLVPELLPPHSLDEVLERLKAIQTRINARS